MFPYQKFCVNSILPPKIIRILWAHVGHDRCRCSGSICAWPGLCLANKLSSGSHMSLLTCPVARLCSQAKEMIRSSMAKGSCIWLRSNNALAYWQFSKGVAQKRIRLVAKGSFMPDVWQYVHCCVQISGQMCYVPSGIWILLYPFDTFFIKKFFAFWAQIDKHLLRCIISCSLFAWMDFVNIEKSKLICFTVYKCRRRNVWQHYISDFH